jgi:hypothetical protein
VTGSDSFLDLLGVAVQRRDDVHLRGGLKIAAKEWVEGAGPDLVTPSATTSLKVARPGYPAASVTCPGNLLRWHELGLPPGPAFTVQAFDEQGHALGAEHEVLFVGAEELLRRAPRPKRPTSEQKPLREVERLPTSTEWVVSLGCLPGQIARYDFGASTRERVPPPLKMWLESDALLLSLPESSFEPAALVAARNSAIAACWLPQTAETESGGSEIADIEDEDAAGWAAWVLSLPTPSSLAHLEVCREAAAVALQQPERFSATWIRRAERLLS